MITIVDYGSGNMASISNMLKRIGVDSLMTNSANSIANATKLILPGIGHFGHGMEQLHKRNLIDVLNQKAVIEKIPVLGICLGAQLLTEESEEGGAKGLGWIKGKTISFDKSKLLPHQKIPHMGWTDVHSYIDNGLFRDMFENPRFYFVHSFHLQPSLHEDILVKANYGYEFAAGIVHENIAGVQFHPEKSHKFGMKLLENFVKNF